MKRRLHIQPFFSDAFLVDPFTAQQQILVFLPVSRVDLQVGQRLEPLLNLLIRHIHIAALKYLLHLLLAGDHLHLHFQNRVDIVGVRHVHSLLTGPAGRNIDHQLSQRQVIGRKAALPLKHIDAYLRLVVAGGIEPFRTAGRDHRIPVDDRAEHAVFKHALLPFPHHLGSQGKRAHVRQDHLFDGFPPLLHGALNRCAQSHGLVGIYIGVWQHLKQPAHKPADNRTLGGAAHQHHLVDIREPDMGV